MTRAGRIVALMKENDMTQAALAETLGVWPNSVQNWVKGKVRPSDEHVRGMAEIFSVTPQYIDWGSADLPESKGFSETKYQALSARDKRIVDAMLEARYQK